MELDKEEENEMTEEFRRFNDAVKRLFSVSKKEFEQFVKRDKLTKINEIKNLSITDKL